MDRQQGDMGGDVQGKEVGLAACFSASKGRHCFQTRLPRP